MLATGSEATRRTILDRRRRRDRQRLGCRPLALTGIDLLCSADLALGERRGNGSIVVSERQCCIKREDRRAGFALRAMSIDRGCSSKSVARQTCAIGSAQGARSGSSGGAWACGLGFRIRPHLSGQLRGERSASASGGGAGTRRNRQSHPDCRDNQSRAAGLGGAAQRVLRRVARGTRVIATETAPNRRLCSRGWRSRSVHECRSGSTSQSLHLDRRDAAGGLAKCAGTKFPLLCATEPLLKPCHIRTDGDCGPFFDKDSDRLQRSRQEVFTPAIQPFVCRHVNGKSDNVWRRLHAMRVPQHIAVIYRIFSGRVEYYCLQGLNALPIHAAGGPCCRQQTPSLYHPDGPSST